MSYEDPVNQLYPKPDQPKPEPPRRPAPWFGPVMGCLGGFLFAQFTPHMAELDRLWAEPPKLVVDDMTATPVQISPQFYIANIIGEKLRDCPVKEDSYVGWALDKQWRIVPFSFVNETIRNARRPKGRQDFGFWQWSISPEDTAVRMTLVHLCGDDEITTEVGPFYIPRAIKIGNI
jgi:hypothetical protein